MTDAPERIWADPDHWIDHPPDDFDGDLSEYAEYIRRDLAKPQWQPIETAPKDETVILVWHVTKLNPYAGFDTNIKKARYLPDLGEWQVEGVGGNVPPAVTHWMPLPDAPEALK